MNMTSEREISIAVLKALKESPKGKMSISELKEEVPNFINLSSEDRRTSPTRPNEEMWGQRLRNIVSHREVEGNIIAEGYVIYDEISHTLKITEAGLKHIESLS